MPTNDFELTVPDLYSYCTETDIIDKHRFPMGSVLLPSATKLQQGYVFTPVCHSVHRGVSATLPPLGGHPLVRHPPWADTSLPSACWLCPVHAGIHTPLCSACWDMVNKQVVRILLECILFLLVSVSVSVSGSVNAP